MGYPCVQKRPACFLMPDVLFRSEPGKSKAFLQRAGEERVVSSCRACTLRGCRIRPLGTWSIPEDKRFTWYTEMLFDLGSILYEHAPNNIVRLP